MIATSSATVRTLTDLTRPRPEPGVSIVVPPTPTPEARIVVRNLMREAADGLAGWYLGTGAIRSIMESIEDAVAADVSWDQPIVGFALYADEGSITLAQGPLEGDPLVQVAPRFHLTHLLADDVPTFAVLTLSLKEAHLLVLEAEGLIEIHEEGFPITSDSVLQYDDRERQLHSHGADRRGTGGVVANFHGHGGRGEVRDEDDLRYLRVVADGVRKALGDEPLVVAATQQLAAMFREVNGYPHLLDATLAGNFDRATPSELQSAAEPLVTADAAKRRDEQLQLMLDKPETVTGIEGVMATAVDGRVHTLIVPPGPGPFGTFDPATRSVDKTPDTSRAEDLTNLAAIETWLHGGEVVRMPVETGRVTALLRY
jgi:hypothetical protein